MKLKNLVGLETKSSATRKYTKNVLAQRRSITEGNLIVNISLHKLTLRHVCISARGVEPWNCLEKSSKGISNIKKMYKEKIMRHYDVASCGLSFVISFFKLMASVRVSFSHFCL